MAESPARKIIHIDMDAFYASVEQRDNPELRGKPVVVGGSPNSRGVVAAASYEVRRFGVHSAMPCAQVVRLCPEAVFVRPRFDVYRSVSQQIREIFFQHTDLVEPLSLDEAFLDVTHNKQGNPSATWLANEIRAKILAETRLTASAGVAPNKFLAKIASDVNKPNGIFVIPPHRVEAFIEGLPIRKFFGIGKATEKKMKALNIHTGADLKACDEAVLVRHFGKTGLFYHRISRGIDNREVKPHRIAKSVGVEETFARDLTSPGEMKKTLRALAVELERRLTKSKTAGKTVTLKLRYGDFTTITRSKSLEVYVNHADVMAGIVGELLTGATEAGERPVRLLGITVSNLNNRKDSERCGHDLQMPLPFGEPAPF